MGKLSKETFASIISYLHLFEKLICLRICRHWHDVISNSNLYTQLTFNKLDEFHKAFLSFDTHDYIGNHDQNLSSSYCSLEIHSILLLPHMFSNVEQLHWEQSGLKSKQLIEYPPKVIYLQELKKWKHLGLPDMEALHSLPYPLFQSQNIKLIGSDISAEASSEFSNQN